jgi:phenylacetate-coenzyme A ligase PaaK-like adenylate-forming protein
MGNKFRNRIFSIKDDADFSGIAFDVFSHQYKNSTVYRTFTDHLGKDPGSIKNLREIPFLPVEFFRDHPIISGRVEVEMIFESSGTAGMVPGKHFVKDLSLYEESFLRSFELFYGDPRTYFIAALLPSYIERCGSSLIYMVEKLIKKSGQKLGGFYKDNTEELIKAFRKEEGRKAFLIGVSFALLELAEKLSPDLSGTIVMETGGMKGRRKELTRPELHSVLKERLNVDSIHSEYGMTELLSQAYSKGNGIFYCPPWMKVLVRDTQDPLSIYNEPGRTGGICIIDLANVNSCSFIATGDLGKLHDDGGFEVLGRFDNSDIRGCNLMVE